MARNLRLTWYLKHQHQATFNLDDPEDVGLLANLVGDDDATPDELVALLDRQYDRADHPLADALMEFRTQSSWVDCDPGDVEFDFTVDGEEGHA